MSQLGLVEEDPKTAIKLEASHTWLTRHTNKHFFFGGCFSLFNFLASA